MIKNTNYWNKDSIVPDKITFVMMKDPTLALAGIKDGSLDFSVYIVEQDLNKLKAEGIVYIAPYFSEQIPRVLRLHADASHGFVLYCPNLLKHL